MKKVLLIAGCAVLGAVVALGGFVAWTFSQMPRRGADRIVAAEGVTGVWADAAYAWIIKTPHGAALVDTGMDPQARAIVAELRREGVTAAQVHTVLLTHGHGDHFGGAIAFPNAKVWIGAEDEALATGKRPARAFMPRMFGWLGARKAPAAWQHVQDGVIEADGVRIQAVNVPGHTAGSAMFVYQGVLFAGDSVFGTPDGVVLAPEVFEEDSAQNRASLAKLKALQFSRIADGHTGLIEDAKPKLAAFAP